MIAIIDYDAGNIKSVEKALNYLGEEAIITRDHDEIVNSDKVILPGVGAFADAMEKIRHYGLEETIHEVVEKNIPFLGICLGLQLMFESSDEGPGVKGLGLLPGKIFHIWDGIISKSKKIQDYSKDCQRILMYILYILTIFRQTMKIL